MSECADIKQTIFMKHRSATGHRDILARAREMKKVAASPVAGRSSSNHAITDNKGKF